MGRTLRFLVFFSLSTAVPLAAAAGVAASAAGVPAAASASASTCANVSHAIPMLKYTYTNFSLN